MHRSRTVGRPRLRVPPPGVGLAVRRTGWGAYLPASQAARRVGPWVFRYAPRSSTVSPSTPGAPWLRLPWGRARRRFSASRRRSRRCCAATGASSPRVPAMASSPGSSRGSSSCRTDALPPLDTWRRRLAVQLLAEHRSGLQLVHVAAPPLGCPALWPWGASRALPASSLLGPRLPSAERSGRLAPPSVPFALDTRPISQGQTPNVPRLGAGLIQPPPCGGRTSPSRARSSRVCHPADPVPVRRPACLEGAASRPHLTVDALALLLACGSANTWPEDLPRARAVPCLAHTPGVSRAGYRVGSRPWLARFMPAEVCPEAALVYA
jgi:hypothetical protein